MADQSKCWTALWSMTSSRKLLQLKTFPQRACQCWLRKLCAVLSTCPICRWLVYLAEFYWTLLIKYYSVFGNNHIFHLMFDWLTVVLHQYFFRYSLGVSQEEMKQELHDYLPSLKHWAKDYLHPPAPKPVGLKMYVYLIETRIHLLHIYLSE